MSAPEQKTDAPLGGTQFEGSFLGDTSRIDPDAVMECAICWTVYDPKVGDDVWQIPPGTAFADLPEHWRCPNCDAEKTGFMVIGSGLPADISGESRPTLEPETPVELTDRIAAIRTAYRAAEVRMRDLPISRKDLSVAVVGFRLDADALVGIVVTPWSMVILRQPTDASEAAAAEAEVERSFPSGDYRFVGSILEGVGAVETCSLFSPMNEFENQEAAVAVAEAAMEGLYIPENVAEAAE